MAQVRQHRPVLLVVAAFSRYDAALDWARRRLVDAWGKICLESQLFSFSETSFYEATMGEGISKQLLAFERLVDPGELPDRKLETNAWEDEYRQIAHVPEPRPLNLDPGYLTEAKLVLASTKDRDHRLYLSKGIFAEVTLYFQQRAWQVRPWTYPDYQRPDYHQFFDRCRAYLRKRYQNPETVLGPGPESLRAEDSRPVDPPSQGSY